MGDIKRRLTDFLALADSASADNAEFIIASRTLAPAMARVLRRLLAVHAPCECRENAALVLVKGTHCRECGNFVFPCPTVLAIQEAMSK